MALREYYIGSAGPFYYDDTAQYPDGSFHQGVYDPGTSYPTSGYSGSTRSITNVRHNAGAAEVKYVDLTIANGIITAVSAESAWTATPLV